MAPRDNQHGRPRGHGGRRHGAGRHSRERQGRHQRRQEREPLSFRLPLPRDVRRALGEGDHGVDPDALTPCRNFGLRFTRYLGFPAAWEWRDGRGNDRKSEVWDGLLKDAAEAFRAQREDHEALLRRRARLVRALSEAHGPSGAALAFTGEVQWRLAVGLGIEHALENGCALHRVLGFPYLPGSSVKGLCRGWRLATWADGWGVPRAEGEENSPFHRYEALAMEPDPENDGARERAEKAYAELREKAPGLPDTWAAFREATAPARAVFGSAGAAGRVRFLDAYPEKTLVGDEPILCLEIVNPHYSDYYATEGGVAPSDWLSPVPSSFLAVRKGTRFGFVLYGTDRALVEEAAGWLRQALEEWGIGAKTSAGYGALTALPGN